MKKENSIPYIYLSPTKELLSKLNKQYYLDVLQFPKVLLRIISASIKNPFKKETAESRYRILRDMYLSSTKKQGEFLYNIARSINAKIIVEFGCSFGVSSIYLAAAVKDNNGDKLITTEIIESKIKRAQSFINQAGLQNNTLFLEGDALQTLKSFQGNIDMLFLDGWEDHYLPLLKLLLPHLKKNAVIIADDILLYKRKLKPYSDFVKDPQNGFSSFTIPVPKRKGMEYSVKLF